MLNQNGGVSSAHLPDILSNICLERNLYVNVNVRKSDNVWD